jgi:hypothetical protein
LPELSGAALGTSVPHTAEALDHRRRGDLLVQISERLGKRLALLSMVRSMTVRSQSNLIQQGICRDWMGQKTSIAGNLVRSKMAHLTRGQDQPQPRPAVVDVPAQFNTTYRAGNVDISQKNVYIVLSIQGRPSFSHVLSLDDFKLSPGQECNDRGAPMGILKEQNLGLFGCGVHD